MLYALHLAAANPGVFDDHTTAAMASALLTFSVVTLLILPGFFLLLWAGIYVGVCPKRGVVATAAGAVLCVVGVAGGVLCGVIQNQMSSDSETAASDYRHAVAGWIDYEYGISVRPAIAQRLIDGEPFVTDYAGSPTTITLIETTSGVVAVVDENRTPLAPRP